MPDISDNVNWSEYDDSNSKASPNGWPEGMMPSGINDSARADRGAIKRFWDRANPTVTTTGAAGTFVYATANNALPLGYVNGELYRFFAHQASAGNDTFQVNLLGSKGIYRNPTTPVVAGDIPSGAVPSLVYESSLNAGAGGFLLLNPYVPFTPDGAAGGTIAGSLNITGNLAVTGNQTLTGTLAVTGATTLHNAVATTPATADNSQAVATTAYVKAQGYATTAGVAAGYLPLSGGSISGSVTASGNLIGNNSVQSNGVYFQNNGGSFYTPQQFLSASNVIANGSVYAGGGGGVYFYNNSGYFYTPNAFQCAGGQANGGWTVTGGLQVNGNINAGSGNNIGGVGLSGNNINVPGSVSAGSITVGTTNTTNVLPQADGAYICGGASLAWLGCESYAFYTKSDPRLKTMTPAPPGALDAVLATPVINYRWRSRPHEPAHIGWDASRARAQLGATVKVGDDTDQTLSLNVMEMVAWLWQAIQELSAQVKQLEAR